MELSKLIDLLTDLEYNIQSVTNNGGEPVAVDVITSTGPIHSVKVARSRTTGDIEKIIIDNGQGKTFLRGVRNSGNREQGGKEGTE